MGCSLGGCTESGILYTVGTQKARVCTCVGAHLSVCVCVYQLMNLGN